MSSGDLIRNIPFVMINYFALTACLRFYYKSSYLALNKLGPKITHFSRKQPSLGEKIIKIWEIFPHLHEISCE